MEAVGVVCYRPNLRRTVTIALIVGTLLVAINEGPALMAGKFGPAEAVRMALNYFVPFIVSNLGLLSGSKTLS